MAHRLIPARRKVVTGLPMATRLWLTGFLVCCRPARQSTRTDPDLSRFGAFDGDGSAASTCVNYRTSGRSVVAYKLYAQNDRGLVRFHKSALPDVAVVL